MSANVRMPVTPTSLSVQSGLVVLNSIYKNSKELDDNYKIFQSRCQQPYDEMMLDCSKLDVEKVVKDFKKIRRPKLEDSIKFKKCLYLYTIKKWRKSLMSQDLMTPEMMRGLMELAIILFRSAVQKSEEPGAITLQAVLTCEWTERVHCLSKGFSVFNHPWQKSSLCYSMLFSSLSTATRLKQLTLERLATDQLMSVVSENCHLLNFLNISHSTVTDAGLLMLAGVEAERRPRLERRCKPRTEPQPRTEGGVVRNITVWWRSVPGRGCPMITHLEAEDLINLDWSNIGPSQYKEFTAVPLDAGFVALLDSLPLTVLNTEVAGRAVLAWSKLMRNLSQTSRRLDLEVLVDSRPSENLLRQVARVCPNLREVRVDWNRFVPDNTPSRDAWLEVLPSIPALESLVSSEIDHRINHKYQADTFLINQIGSRLTKLHLQQLRSITFSLLRSIKENCSNLEKLALFMTGQLGFRGDLEVEKDDHLQKNSGNLSKLREFHLMGPFSSCVTRYLLDTSHDLESLTLSVDWPESHNFNLIPDRRLDFLGINYMNQVMQGNSLTKVKEVHLMVQHYRGMRHLNKDFAKFVMKKLPSLQHMGNFKGWNMNNRQKREIRAFQVAENLNISIDPDDQVKPRTGQFSKIYSGNQLSSSCLWLPVDPAPPGLFMGLMANFFGPDGAVFVVPPGQDSSDDEDDGGPVLQPPAPMMPDDVIIDISSDEEEDVQPPPPQGDQPVNQVQEEEQQQGAGVAYEPCNIM